jgi:HEAT repeat protein
VRRKTLICSILGALAIVVVAYFGHLRRTQERGDDRPQGLRGMIQRLGSEHTAERAAAALEFVRLGPQVGPAVPTLLERLEAETEPSVRADLVLALVCAGRQAVPGLIRGLQNGSDAARRDAAWALAGIGPDAATAVPALARLLETEDYELLQAGQGALESIGLAALPVLIERLGRHEDARDLLASVCEELGKPALPTLVRLLASEDESVRDAAAFAIWHVGRNAVGALRPLLKALTSDAFGNRSDLVMALGEMGTAAAPAVPILVRLLEQRAVVSRCLVETLGKIGEGAREAVPALTRALQTAEASMRARIALGLWQITRESERIVPILSRILESAPGYTEAVIVTMDAVRAMGPDARELLPALVHYAVSNPGEGGSSTSDALAALGPVAVPALRQLMRLGNLSVQRVAVDALADIGPGARGALAELAPLLRTRNAQLRRSAARAIGNVGPAAKSVASHLIDLLEDEEMFAPAAYALYRVGGHLDAVRAALSRGLVHPKPEIADAALRVLERMGSDAHTAVPLLIRRLQAGPDNWDCLIALGKIGRLADAAVPAIRPFLDHRQAAARNLAARVLWRIRGDAEELQPLLRDLASPAAGLRIIGALELGRAAPLPPAATAALVHSLADHRWRVRKMAAWALGQCGAAARQALPQLRERAEENDEDERVREEARRAVAKCGG